MGFLEYLRRSNGQLEAKSSLLADWPWSATPPTDSLLFGRFITPEVAAGLPAWFAVIRRIAQGAAMCPLEVYRGPREKRERWDDSPVADLLRRPGDGYTPYSFRADLAASYAATGQAFIRKFKARGRVAELMVLDPLKVRVERRNGRVVYLDSTVINTVDGMRSPVERGRDEIIHVRDFALGGGLEAQSPIHALRNSVSGGQRRQQFQASYYENDARPGIVLKFPMNLGINQVREFLTAWNANYQGSKNAGKASALGGGAELETVPPVSLDDAQFVESEQLTLDTIAGLYGFSSRLVGRPESATEEDRLNFVTFGLGPMFTSIETALSADEDLFPRGATPAFVEHNADRLLRATTQARFDAHSKARQGGWKTLNEIRAEELLPPVEGGDTVQLTPVGGPVDRTPGGPDQTAPDDTTEVAA